MAYLLQKNYVNKKSPLKSGLFENNFCCYYSYFKELAGFALAALNVRVLKVNKETNNTNIPAIGNSQIEILTR